MMQDVGSSALVYLAWIVGGLLSLFGAMTYAELGAMLPYAGGEYVYLRGAYGDTTAFLYMWTWFAVAKPASIAAVTIGLGTHARVSSLRSTGSAQIPESGPVPLLWSQVFAIAVTWFMTGLNYLGIKKAARLSACVHDSQRRADSDRGGALLRLELPARSPISPQRCRTRSGRIRRLHARAHRHALGL